MCNKERDGLYTLVIRHDPIPLFMPNINNMRVCKACFDNAMKLYGGQTKVETNELDRLKAENALLKKKLKNAERMSINYYAKT